GVSVRWRAGSVACRLGGSYSNVASVTPGGTQGPLPGSHSPVIGHQRMVMPSQPLLTATKKTAKPQGQSSPGAVRAQPVPASYTTASTPAQPTFNVQVKTAQPNPHFMAPGPSPYPQLQPEPVVSSPHHTAPGVSEHGYRAPEPAYSCSPTPSHYPDPTHSAWQPEPTHYQPEPTHYQPEPTHYQPEPTHYQPEPTHYQPEPTHYQPEPTHCQPPDDTRKTYIIDPAPGAAPPQPKNIRNCRQRKTKLHLFHLPPSCRSPAHMSQTPYVLYPLMLFSKRKLSNLCLKESTFSASTVSLRSLFHRCVLSLLPSITGHVFRFYYSGQVETACHDLHGFAPLESLRQRSCCLSIVSFPA
uniref:Uncharacterized protein n=1 Tax=Callorhinchus milii TaxID=7868 RepID=A0A4W3GRB3_CALMI